MFHAFPPDYFRGCIAQTNPRLIQPAVEAKFFIHAVRVRSQETCEHGAFRRHQLVANRPSLSILSWSFSLVINYMYVGVDENEFVRVHGLILFCAVLVCFY